MQEINIYNYHHNENNQLLTQNIYTVEVITNNSLHQEATVADLEPSQAYYRSASAKTYRIEYVLSRRTNDILIATFFC